MDKIFSYALGFFGICFFAAGFFNPVQFILSAGCIVGFIITKNEE